MAYPTPPVPNYVDYVGPAITSAEMNWLDQQARTAGVGLSNPVTIAQGGTQASNAPQALANLGAATASSVSALQALMTQAGLSSILIPPTQAEAGLTIVNQWYAPGVVDRYGTNTTPGTTPMTAAFQAAINQARKGGVDVVWGATAPYLLDGVLDCTFTGSAQQAGITFRQTGTPGFNEPPSLSGGILVKHNGYAVFDLTGCSMFGFHDLTLVTSQVAGQYPKTCFLTARNTTGESNFPRFYNTSVAGNFSMAILFNYGSEDGVYVGNYWDNEAPDAGAKVVAITANNYFNGAPSGLTSAFTTMVTSPPAQSCIDHQFFGGQFLMKNASSTSDIFYLEQVENLKAYSLWMDCVGAAANGRSFFYVDMVNNPSNFVKLRDIQGERGTYAPNYGVLFSNAAGTCTGFGLLDCYWQVGTYSIAAAGSTPVVDSMHVYGLQEFGASKGINIPGTLSGSVVVFPGIINVGTFTGLIQGNSSNITITNQNGVIIDQGSGNLLASGGLGLYKNPAAGQLAGWGTPTSGSVVNNFPGSGASTAQCGSALTEIIITLKAFGLFGA